MAVELEFSRIDEEGWVYVNGQKVGESHEWRLASRFDVKRALHAGDNTVAVIVANNTGSGGLNNGVTLQFQEKPSLPQWQRSAFNGLAQVIVQSTKAAGTVRLTARAEGLKPATTEIYSRPCPLVAEVP